jgi:predicted nucleic acid-binding protein
VKQKPLLVFDTNVLMDVWLGRDGDQAILLVQLAESGKVELVIPEYVMREFRGTALRLIREERAKLDSQVRAPAKSWSRSGVLGEGAELIQAGARIIQERLEDLSRKVDGLASQLAAVAKIVPHTMAIHFQGDLRYLSGHPPDRPTDGIKDCRIYEAILDVAKGDEVNRRPKFLVTKDSDFDYPELRAELATLGFSIRGDLGRLYGELRGL